MSLLDPESYARALKVFNIICIEWRLKSAEKASLAVSSMPEYASLITMSRVFGIYRSLHTIFQDHDQANSWIRKENADLGSSAVELIRTARGLEKVQNYLFYQEGVVFTPITQEIKGSIESLIEGPVFDLDERLEIENEAGSQVEADGVNQLIGLSKEASRRQAIANCRLSGLTVTPEMFDLIDQVNAGEITTKEAIESLLKK